MTNETTASQPTEFKGDTPALCRAIDALLTLDASGSLVPHGLGGHARTLLNAASLRLAASQPKSIGDDARLEQLFHTYYKSQTVDEMTTLKAAIISHILRAPAVQASATIQAVPDTNELHFNAQRLRNVAALVGVPADGDDAQVDGVRGALLGLIAGKLRRAATIQELVMVAEPVGYAHPISFLNLSMGASSNEWMWAKQDAGMVPLYRAAPMVADPAGVVGACETCGGAGVVDDGEINCYPNGTPYENGPVKCGKDCPSCTLADTVKAVPSEALEYLGADGKYLDTQGWSVENYDIGDTVTVPIHRNGKVIALVVAEYSEDFREVIGENCRLLTGAAPLADKTGRGE